jgi:scyllo-inositol 2-dehydrogenase (NADP+)
MSSLPLHPPRGMVFPGCAGPAVRTPCSFRVLGTGGTFEKHGFDVQEAQLIAGTVHPTDPAFGAEPDSAWGTLTPGAPAAPRRVPSVRGQWAGFYPAVAAAVAARDQALAPVQPASVVAVLGLMEAARLSAAEHRRVVLDGVTAPPA